MKTKECLNVNLDKELKTKSSSKDLASLDKSQKDQILKLFVKIEHGMSAG